MKIRNLKVMVVFSLTFVFFSVIGCTGFPFIPSTSTKPAYANSGLPTTTRNSTTPTVAVTPIYTLTPITTEKAPASTEWQLSPDGHIYYKESELYDGMFTINKEHPEYVEKYWEDTIRGLWNLNNIGENTAFINQFPTDDALVQYLKDGGGPVSNLWIPVIYPDSRRWCMYMATLVPTNQRIDLSQIAIAIYKPTTDEIYKYSPSYATGTEYISYYGAAGEASVKVTEINDEYILKITHRKDLLSDSIKPARTDKTATITENFVFLAQTEEKSSEENLLAAIQLLRMWPVSMQIKSYDWADAVVNNTEPLMINFSSIGPTYEELVNVTTFEGSPISLR